MLEDLNQFTNASQSSHNSPPLATTMTHPVVLTAEQFQQLLNNQRPQSSGGKLGLKDYKIEDYSGERSARVVTSWINRMERGLNLLGSQISDGIDEATAIAIASYNLKDKAQVWWDNLLDMEKPTNWKEFKVAVRNQFIPTNNAQRIRDRLSDLRQTTSVHRYYNAFSDLLLELGDEMSDADKLDRFMRGLKEQIRLVVRAQLPQTFEEATKISLAIDSDAYQASKGKNHFSKYRSADNGPQPMELGKRELNQSNGKALGSGGKRTLICDECGKSGHGWKYCPQLTQKYRQKREQFRRTQVEESSSQEDVSDNELSGNE